MYEFSKVLKRLSDWQQDLPSHTASLLERLNSGALPCHAFGRNVHSEFVRLHLQLAGVVDDYAEPDTDWHGLSTLSFSDLPEGAVIVNSVLHRRPQSALARIASVPKDLTVLHYSDFTRLDAARFPPLPFVAEARSAVFENLERFDEVFARLADDESRQVLHDVALYRMTGDPSFTRAYRLRDEAQYFDLPLALRENPVFVDGGAYQGETTESFCRKFSRYTAAHVFEPHADSMREAQKRLAELPNIYFHPYALGDRHAQLSFDASAANASRISERGSETIKVVPLDDVVPGQVDFIKFDLEGYEPKALIGARQTITNHHPTLAVCVYHHMMDFIDVPKEVWSARRDYRLQLRHYTEGWEETVMYFIPAGAP